MKIPNPRAPAQSKPPPNSGKPEQLSAHEVKKLTKAGKQDGFHSLPKQDENGVWSSPLLQKEADAYDEFCVFTWSELQQKHEQWHREISELCQEIHRIEERLDAQRKAAPPPPDLTERLAGEEKHSEKLIRTRRQREYEQENAKYFNVLRRIEGSLDEARRRLSELCGVVQAAEKTTAMLCERAAGQALKRITVYWQGALQTHPRFDEIPAVPEVTLESNAEADYHERNKAIMEEAKRVLARGQYTPNSSGGPAANTTRRTEERHVTKKKQTRK